MFSKKQKSQAYNRGFSLPELLVTTAIITIVTAIVVVKHASFNNTVLLRNQAYEIALALREAQVYAVSARGDATDFRARYGLYFNKTSAGDHQVIVYVENSASGAASKRYDSGSDTILETLVLDSRFHVKDICVNTGSVSCSPNYVSISFKRPNFDPIMSPAGISDSSVRDVSIEIAPVNGSALKRTITVTQTGQISVK